MTSGQARCSCECTMQRRLSIAGRMLIAQIPLGIGYGERPSPAMHSPFLNITLHCRPSSLEIHILYVHAYPVTRIRAMTCVNPSCLFPRPAQADGW